MSIPRAKSFPVPVLAALSDNLIFHQLFPHGISECSTNSHQPAHRVPAVTPRSQLTNHNAESCFFLLSKAKSTANLCGAVTPSACPGTPSLPSGAGTGGSPAPCSHKPLWGSRGSPTLISTDYGLWRNKDKACWAGRVKQLLGRAGKIKTAQWQCRVQFSDSHWAVIALRKTALGDANYFTVAIEQDQKLQKLM